MSDNKNDSKSKVLIITAIIVLIIAVIGVSYAAIFYSKIGDEVNNVSTGTIVMSYTENTNGIYLTNASPMTDEVGRTLTDENLYFDFTVNATMSGNANVDYVISASKDSYSTLEDSAVKVYLTSLNGTNETTVLAPTKVSSLRTTNDIFYVPDNQYVILESNFIKSESRNYRLRMWVSDDYVLPSISQTYMMRVNVYANMSV
ncbi:MAG TPA: hypothetical protein IAB59_02555 [Candidatus Onthousia faecipullorum]|uniref:Uncharacterized protein n=1 Tax=Candidatus Onthousia faecipullorum TaxID=2840887 RepID=A0A9D1KBM8_9FIRM|nr:hypothetical protein [Candidatus Onthousia faecipullorum]